VPSFFNSLPAARKAGSCEGRKESFMDKVSEIHDHAHGAKRLQLRIASRVVQGQKRAIWQATKQFTWWLLVVAVTMIWVGLHGSTSFKIRAIVILVGLFVGCVWALMAFCVVRRQEIVLNEGFKVYDRLVKELELDEPSYAAEDNVNKGVGGLIAGLFGGGKLQAWDLFQAAFLLTSLLYGAGFVVVLVYSIVKLT
jgi:hypothetical protein